MAGGGIVGYSGHELGTATTLATIPLGAKVIERHITLDRTMKGPDHAVSLEPREFVGLVRDIRNIELALKMDSKYVTRGEYINRKILSKSLVAAVAIRKGQLITKNMITVKSPAKGLSPQKLYNIIGRRSVRNMKKDEYFTESDLGIKPTPHNTVLKGKWGLIVRPSDYEKMLTGVHPKCIEFHFGFHDLKYPFEPKKPITTELIVHAPELWGTTLLDLCSKDKKILTESIKNTNMLFDRVRTMRTYFTKTPKKVKVVLHPGGMSYHDFTKPTEKEEMYRTLARSLQRLDLHGIDLLLENLPPFPWYKGGQWFSNVFTDAQEIADFAKKYRYNICYDTSHAQLYCTFAGKDMIAFFRTIKPFVSHIHLSDGKGSDGEGLQIGDGDVLWEKIIPEIKKANTTFTPEIWMGHRYGGEGFWVALRKLKKYKL
ncbi:N-acetylneuraminate synthase family protein, partial [Candidatus Woesearchaeota archaeon]|nr:N-acetylneuraminate synthase family protein [Candidatus Woesearchaeota archaeon]